MVKKSAYSMKSRRVKQSLMMFEKSLSEESIVLPTVQIAYKCHIIVYIIKYYIYSCIYIIDSEERC